MNPFKEQITYWAPGTTDGFGGVSYATPVTLYARWEDRQEEFVDAAGKISISRCIVFVPGTTTLALGGYLCLGDQTANSTPAGITGAFEIRQLIKTPDLRRIKYELRAIL